MQDGIQKLQKALELRPDYDDAMAYLNLLYREEADLQCDNPDARKTDLKTADDWVDKTMATKKAKAEKAGPSWRRDHAVAAARGAKLFQKASLRQEGRFW